MEHFLVDVREIEFSPKTEENSRRIHSKAFRLLCEAAEQQRLGADVAVRRAPCSIIIWGRWGYS